jgi:xanthine/CO dehydrogenase XdhC/CoxF family maturation factor
MQKTGNSLYRLLCHWQQYKVQYQWILATVIEVIGSSYRKPGAMMLINDQGRYFGLISGGCLEADVMRQAQRCWQNNQASIIDYDMTDEDELGWQLGCGGEIKVLLQPLNQENHYHQLDELLEKLEKQQAMSYQLAWRNDLATNQVKRSEHKGFQQQLEEDKTNLSVYIPPPISLAIFGGGIDARPLAQIATQLGWKTRVIDPRTSYARQVDFPDSECIEQAFVDLAEVSWLTQFDAAVVMTHNLAMDAQALQLLSHSRARYIGLLGSEHRTDKIKQHSQSKFENLPIALSNPIGLRLGGDLPESLALAIVAEIHAVIYQKNARSISGVIASQI